MRNRNFLHLIVIISIVVVLSLCCLNIFFISPSFIKQIIRNTEYDAVKIGNHLKNDLQGTDILQKQLPDNFDKFSNEAVEDFGLFKLKVFASDGLTIYSTENTEIGSVNEKPYFHNIVAKGEVYTKLVKKDSMSLDDVLISVDVVETYVPIIIEGQFAGAFEIYLDITDSKMGLDSLVFHTNLILLFIVISFITISIFISMAAGKSIKKNRLAEKWIFHQTSKLTTINKELSVINELSSILSTSLELQDLMLLVLSTIIDNFPIDNLLKKGAILLVEGDSLILSTQIGIDNSTDVHPKKISINECRCGASVQNREIIIVSDQKNNDSGRKKCLKCDESQGQIIVPLKSSPQIMGVLSLFLPANFSIDHSKIKLLESIGNQIGMAIEKAKLHEETKSMALCDQLTGLGNRHFMDISFQQAVSVAERYNHPLSTVLIDIDYFKKYNDSKGHDAGDKLLTKIAKKILDGCRDSDIAIRYGGEEFLLILPDSNLDVSYKAIERIRLSVEKSLDVTISAGIALFKKGIPINELIKNADEALYRAKNSGRNKVVSEKS